MPCRPIPPARTRRSLRPRLALTAALGAAAFLVTGCHQAAPTDNSPASAIKFIPDTPTAPPPASALFATAAVAAPPAQQIARAPLPPRPPDSGQVVRQALQAAPAPTAGTARNAGLIVCDPVSGHGLNDFGTGCGRWLDMVTAGQPELGRTPLWESRTRAAEEMGRSDLALTPAQARALWAMTGATHAACGALTGAPARATLTYQLYDLRTGRAAGKPLTASGSEAQLLAALPGLARALDAQLGVHTPRVPAALGLSPAELARVVALSKASDTSDADLLALSRLSGRSPLAGLAFGETRADNDQGLRARTVRTLLTQLPGNALLLAHLGSSGPAALRPYATTVRALIARYPASALLAHTDVWTQRVWGTRAGELKAAQRATVDAPTEPDAWLSLGYTLGDIAEDMRQGRFANDLSPAEWQSLGHLYSQQERAILRATTLDPRDGHAWLRLTEAATFASDPRAAQAFSRALSLDPDKEEVYAEGLQMFQPKWGGDPAALARVAGLAAAQRWDDSTAAVDIATNLRDAGEGAQADGVLTGFIARERARVAQNPSDVMAHWGLAYALAGQGNSASLREASLEYRTAAHLMPNASAIHDGLADVLDKRGRTQEAVAEYRKAAALDPFDADIHFSLGYDLKHERHFPEALAELRLAMRLDPRNANAHFGLGDLLAMQHQYRPAVAEYQEAIRMQFYLLDAWLQIPNALDGAGEYDASLQAAQEADHLLTEQEQNNGETESPLHDTMADDYLHKKQWARSIAQSNVSLGYNANDACAHENLAEAYIGQGRKAEAQAEWHKAIALGDPAITPAARKLLAAHGMQ